MHTAGHHLDALPRRCVDTSATRLLYSAWHNLFILSHPTVLCMDVDNDLSGESPDSVENESDSSLDLRVPVKIRSHEQEQLEQMVSDVRAHYEQAGVDDRAEQIGRVEDTILDWNGERADERFVRHLSLAVEDWQELVIGLTRVEGKHGVNRVDYLRRKLFSRVRNRVEELQ